ncbi:outer membrane protein assembly factor BamD [Candidatus Nitrotoga sp. 1052]|uniref:outer membrane protein assembly factor BamD n=1 Tax=Candidatus Nitrotoga sp. 1052 TaxID=2886964 RepID=UPI001EF6B761|nr:outer membrane protein assembly factor BamD [Candidatus Nitrotoga sp. 1052]
MRHSLTLILLFMLTACSIFSPKNEKSAADSAEGIYAQATEQMNNANYPGAIKLFETLQSRYPYGRYAQQAQMEIAYAYYKQNEPESALSAVERFIKQYPNSPNVDYAYYLKGLVNFDEDLGIFGEGFQPDVSERNPKAPREAFDAFKDLVTRFPNSKYAADSKLRMQYLINALARHETQVASYYLRRGAYVAAINRANGVLIEFPQAPATRDALQIMVQAYDAMGQKDLRDDSQRVLDKNIAKDGIKPAVKKSPENKKSWWQFWK